MEASGSTHTPPRVRSQRMTRAFSTIILTLTSPSTITEWALTPTISTKESQPVKWIQNGGTLVNIKCLDRALEFQRCLRSPLTGNQLLWASRNTGSKIGPLRVGNVYHSWCHRWCKFTSLLRPIRCLYLTDKILSQSRSGPQLSANMEPSQRFTIRTWANWIRESDL